MIAASAASAGPEVTLYLTLPLGGASGHVLGLRLDKSSTPANMRVINPESPLNRRALLDLQLGADSALRLELARRLTWDIERQELRPSTKPASFTLRLPVQQVVATAAAEHAAVAAVLAKPLLTQLSKPLVRSLAVQP
jgi:hypothetical protein